MFRSILGVEKKKVTMMATSINEVVTIRKSRRFQPDLMYTLNDLEKIWPFILIEFAQINLCDSVRATPTFVRGWW